MFEREGDGDDAGVLAQAVRADELRTLLARLEIPVEALSVLGVRRRLGGGVTIHLLSTYFWRVVKRTGGQVTSEEQDDLHFPHRHRLVLEGVELLTYTSEPVLPPGTVTPGYALRLT
jgi:hypothetical protein